MNPKVAIVILNYNGWQHTTECLESLYQITYPDYQVILVDNASDDGSLAKIRAYCRNEVRVDSKFVPYSVHQKPIIITEYTRGETEAGGKCVGASVRPLPSDQSLVLIKNERNYGFAEGANIGVRYALRALDPDYVLLLNNDTVVDERFLRELVDAASRDQRICLIQPKVLRYSDSALDNTGLLCDVLGYICPRGSGEKDQGQYDEEREKGFFCASGACLLIRKSLLLALDGECFDPFFFAYHEDVDLSWMARLLSGKVVYCPTSICHHKLGATLGRHSPWTAYLGYRNRLRVLIKNYSFAVLAIALPVFILMKLFLLSSGAILNMRSDYLKGFLRALCWNIQNISSTLDRRRFIQSRRQLSDKEVMKYMVRHSLEVESALRALSPGGVIE